MSRWMLLAFTIAAALGAHATTKVSIDPPPPYYADDTVRIVLSSDEAQPNEAFDVQGHHMTVMKKYDSGQEHVWLGTFYDTGHGTLDIRAPGRIDGPAHLEFDVLPPLLHSWSDPAALAQELITAKRKCAFPLAEASRSRVFVGEQVRVTWSQLVPDEYDVRLSLNERVPGLNVEYPVEQGWQVPVGTVMLKKKVIAAATIVPTEAGTLEIPELRFEGGPLDNYGQVYGYRTPFTRLSNALRIEVVAPPAEAAGLPIGKFTMTCGTNRSDEYWPVEGITIRGEGNLASIRKLELATAVTYPVIFEKWPAYAGESAFRMIVHAHDIGRFPTPRLRYYDPAEQKVAVATCAPDSPNVAQRKKEDIGASLLRARGRERVREQIRVDEQQQNTKPPTEEEVHDTLQAFVHLRNVAAVLALAGVIGIIVAAALRV